MMPREEEKREKENASGSMEPEKGKEKARETPPPSAPLKKTGE